MRNVKIITYTASLALKELLAVKNENFQFPQWWWNKHDYISVDSNGVSPHSTLNIINLATTALGAL